MVGISNLSICVKKQPQFSYKGIMVFYFVIDKYFCLWYNKTNNYGNAIQFAKKGET